MEWKQAYELDISFIDTQHKQLFRFNDELENAIRKGLKVSDLTAILINVKQYAARHFAMEEKFMNDVSYPELESQKDAHIAFTTRFGEIQDEFNEQGVTPEITGRLREELIGWINDHITGMDQAFGEYCRQRNESS